MSKALRAQRRDAAVEGIEGGVLAGEHNFGVSTMAGLHEEDFLGAVGEEACDFCGGGETAATVGGGRCFGGVEIEGFEDCGVDLHL